MSVKFGVHFLAVVLAFGASPALAAVSEFPAGKEGAIAFTFDDGTVDQYDVALPLMAADRSVCDAAHEALLKFVSPSGMLWDYLGPIPTPQEMADGRRRIGGARRNRLGTWFCDAGGG